MNYLHANARLIKLSALTPPLQSTKETSEFFFLFFINLTRSNVILNNFIKTSSAHLHSDVIIRATKSTQLQVDTELRRTQTVAVPAVVLRSRRQRSGARGSRNSGDVFELSARVITSVR